MMARKHNGQKKEIVSSFKKALKSFGSSFPILLGIILVLGLLHSYVSSRMLTEVFSGELVRDTIIGSVAGSISAGNAVVCYIIGGELLKENVSLIAVTSFILAWVTVGIIQLPAEAAMLGRRFAIIRLASSYILAILVSLATVQTLMMIQ